MRADDGSHLNVVSAFSKGRRIASRAAIAFVYSFCGRVSALLTSFETH